VGALEESQFSALDCAVAGAEASAQGALFIWKAMSRDERERWRETRATVWPRVGLLLQPVLDAAARILEEEQEFEEQLGR
jgi:hypothetical protein